MEVFSRRHGKVTSVTVDMGKPLFASEEIPTSLVAVDVPNCGLNEENKNAVLPKKAVVNAPLIVAENEYRVTCVNVGNPHCVVFSKFVDKEPVAKIGPLFESHSVFPEKTNTEFVRVVGPNELKMRTWERGNGETLACGTGACAAAVASVINGFSPINQDITVKVRGGNLIVKYTGETVLLTGNTKMCYQGEVEI